jgi:hypothetical protein
MFLKLGRYSYPSSVPDIFDKPQTQNMNKIWIGIALVMAALAIWGCARKLAHPPSTAREAVAPSPACGPLLEGQLAHVYHPDRLQVKERCKVVTGIIDSVRSERDGDYHIRLHLDPGQGELTNAKNNERQEGDLVVEPICEHPVTQEDAIKSCDGFSGGVPRPRKGMHVRVIGPLVLDTQHGWNEIHPAVLIEEMP